MELCDNKAGEYGRFYDEWTDSNREIKAYTSGSTGIPKEILLPKTDMVLSARATNKYFNLGKDSLIVSPLSVRYIAGKMMLVRACEANCRLLCETPSNYPLSEMAEWENDEIDLVAVVPSQLNGLLSSKYLNRIKHVIVGGAPLSEEQEKQLTGLAPRFYSTYGMTETCSHVALRCCGETWYKGLPGVKFHADKRGCLVIEREGMSTQRRVVTNDIVELRSETEFRWIGRADNVIISGGLKISPEEVENKIAGLIKSPYYIAGEKNEKWGESVVLYIEKSEFIDTDALKGELRCLLNRHEMPGKIVFIEKIPRTENGKIKR